MLRLYADTEANDLLPKVNKLHCIAAVDLDTGERHLFDPTQLDEGLALLSRADLIIGHNWLRYDAPMLKKVVGWTASPHTVIRDSLILARFVFPNIKQTDSELVKRGKLPSKLHGKDTLGAWGLRIGIPKADYDGGFEEYTPEMGEYCLQDCITGAALVKYLKFDTLSQGAVELEHRVAILTEQMTEAGWPFDLIKATDLYTEMVGRRDELERALVERFGEWEEVDRVVIPKRDNKKLGYIKGEPVTKYKTVIFNPRSRVHIEKKLREVGWKPQEFTESGRAKLDEEVLGQIDIPEAKDLVTYLLIEKRLGQLGDGDSAWLKTMRNGRIHSSYNPLGTVTHRASHFSPNIAQVPKVKKNTKKEILVGEAGGWGAECRELFHPGTGFIQVGADMSGLELRCLGSYLAHFDKGRYAELVVSGDPHQKVAELANLPREQAKTLKYAFVYGAKDTKLGKIAGGSAKRGAELRKGLFDAVPGLSRLVNMVHASAAKGYVKALDGRNIPVRGQHSVLNTLLQSAGAILCKRWIVKAFDELIAKGMRWGEDFVFLGWIHDELQVACRPELAEEIAALLVDTARRAAEGLDFRCPLDGEAKIGKNWRECH
jgi:DNA polymerase-1